MSTPRATRRGRLPGRALALLTSVAVMMGGLLAAPATAAPSPLEPRSPEVVTADALPTVQHNGIVWSQAVVGNTVYAGGSFSQARPAGAAPGTNETPRGNLLAYDITDGTLRTSFAPSLNGQVVAVAASPDGTRVYVGGDFTQANGQPRGRIAAYSTSTGQLLASFAPPVNYQVRAIVATNSTVYVGGSFAGVGSQSRSNLAAFNAANGALLNWAPTADRPVSALTLTADGKHVIAGGAFEQVNGSPTRGLAKLDAATGELQAWPVPISNAGADAAITSLSTDGAVIYGTGYHFGPGGNTEGPFSLDAGTGELLWIADCHGDTYSQFAAAQALYVVGHPHYCGNVGGGLPQYSTWRYQHSMAFTKKATGTTLREVHGYANWEGRPSPSIVHWLPTMAIGSVSGAYQAGWHVTGNDRYVVVGGEFPRVNGTAQQGLVRFATTPTAPAKRGPAFPGNQLVPDLQPAGAGSVKVGWTAGYDQDDMSLRYELVRTPGGVVHTVDADSNWWHVPAMSHVDTGLTPGATYSYQLRVSDGSGNRVFGATRQITAPAGVERGAYAARVLADGARLYWPLDEPTGTFRDHAGASHGVPGTSVTRGTAGAVPGSTAITVSNTNAARSYASGTEFAPTEMSASVWIRTTAGSGRVLGFGDIPEGSSGHRDRQIYLNNSGRINFGVRADGAKVLTSTRAYNDNQWHHVVATLSGTTASLYVDGVRVARRADITNPEVYIGQWRLSGDNMSGWPNAGTANFVGSLDEVALFPKALTAEQVNAQYVASGRTSQLPSPPADAYGALVLEGEPDLYWRLGEASGTRANDAGPALSHGTYVNSHTKGVAGALQGVSDTAVRFPGTDGFVSSDAAFAGPSAFSTEAWFSTTATTGGKIVGFGSSRTGLSSTYDRHTFIRDDGRLVFGVSNNGEHRVTSPKSYNDGRWHHVVATLSGAGMRLYVDGELVGSSSHTATDAYTGYWKVGGDRVWSGASSSYLTGAVDEVAVYPRALTQAQVLQRYAAGSGGAVNTPPSAAFTHERSGLEVAFDGSGSVDEDGEVTGYSWSFGDGTTGSGAKVTHTYPAPGDYSVTLTVTDDAGATDSTKATVTVASPPSNTAPTASFDHSVSGLEVSVDGTGSTDTDGTVTAHAWDFGDGGTASTATATHRYAAPGTYSVTLTVTDDGGATDSTTQKVTVDVQAGPRVVAADAFERTVTGGFGTADTGGAWEPVGSTANFWVRDGAGTIRMTAPGSGPRIFLAGVSAADVDVTHDVALDKLPTGGGTFVTLRTRRVQETDYRTKLVLRPDSTVLVLARAENGTETTLASTVLPAQQVYRSGDVMRVRMQVEGSEPTTVRAKVWKAGQDEPATWQLTRTDATPALQGAGGLGVQAYLSGSATNAPVLAHFDNLTATAIAP